MKDNCAPGKYDKKHNTCFDIDQLMLMAQAYNRFLTKNHFNPSNVKKVDSGLIEIKRDKYFLLLQFKKIFDNVCKESQECWSNQEFMNQIVDEMKNDIINNTFRPIGPTNPNEWLSTSDINNIMYQYQNIYSDFIFLGAVPLNCDDFEFCALHRLKFADYEKKRIKQLAIIFNLDRYGEPGSHWVALYMNLSNGEICFCDSNGKQPVDNINNIINNFKKYFKNKTGKNATCHVNIKSYQKDGSECGVYSCNFIIRKLAGESFDSIIKNSLSFKQINSCRNIYFRNGTSIHDPTLGCDPANS